MLSTHVWRLNVLKENKSRKTGGVQLFEKKVMIVLVLNHRVDTIVVEDTRNKKSKNGRY